MLKNLISRLEKDPGYPRHRYSLDETVEMIFKGFWGSVVFHKDRAKVLSNEIVWNGLMKYIEKKLISWASNKKKQRTSKASVLLAQLIKGARYDVVICGHKMSYDYHNNQHLYFVDARSGRPGINCLRVSPIWETFWEMRLRDVISYGSTSFWYKYPILDWIFMPDKKELEEIFKSEDTSFTLKDIRAFYDILLSIFGPDFPENIIEEFFEKSEESEKDTDEVKDSSIKENDDFHGGDNASKEVEDSPNSAEDGAEDKEEKSSPSGKDGDDGQNETDDHQSDSGKDGEDGEGYEGFGHNLDQQVERIRNTVLAMEQDCYQRRREELDKESEEHNARYLKEYPQNANKPIGFGGLHYDKLPLSSFDAKKRASVSKLVTCFDRLARTEIGSFGKPSPRFKPATLARELVSKRYQFSRARKEEMKPGLLLILADVSGSCSAAATETVLAAKNVAAKRDNVMVIIHSNGEPIEYYFDGMYCPRNEDHYKYKLSDLYVKICDSYSVKVIVSFGDGDAAYVYEYLLNHTKAHMFWLDSYAATWGWKISHQELEGVKDPSRLTYIQGVNGVIPAAEAIQHVLKARR